ncbi:hypothetical protein [Streptomyces sp. STR69]|uniref:hypothetical protein n=1 Tax=Streptomyces sp. STR69 TaxID=1796942 RepID=UPI0021C8DFFE|nr:hypothetical protein [Streptomyces sp. STR69]
MVAVACLLQLLILVGALYDTAHLLHPSAGRRPARSGLRSRRAALEAAEQRLVAERLRGRIDAASYRERMRSLAERD